MKLCKLCQFKYDDRVEFCFRDGTPLERIAEPAPSSAQPYAFDAQDDTTLIMEPEGAQPVSAAPKPVFPSNEAHLKGGSAAQIATRPPEVPRVEMRKPPTFSRGGNWEVSGTAGRGWPDAPLPPASTTASPNGFPGQAAAHPNGWIAPEDDSISSIYDELAADGGFPDPEEEPRDRVDGRTEPPSKSTEDAEEPTQPVLPPAIAFGLAAKPMAIEEPETPIGVPQAARDLSRAPERKKNRLVVLALVAALCLLCVAIWVARRHPALKASAEAVATAPAEPAVAEAPSVPAPPTAPATLPVSAPPPVNPGANERKASDPVHVSEREVVPEQTRPATIGPTEPERPHPEESSERQTEALPFVAATQTANRGAFSIDSNPTGADVYFDDKLVGRTPIQKMEGQAGLHTIAFKKPGFGTISRAVEITPGSNVELSPIQLRSLEPSVGIVNVSSARMAPGSKLFVDGNLAGVLPISVKLPEGDHTFRVLGPDGTSFSVMRKVGFNTPGQAMSLELSTGG
jgi:hypothetical protein